MSIGDFLPVVPPDILPACELTRTVSKGKAEPRQAEPKGGRGQLYPRKGSGEKAVAGELNGLLRGWAEYFRPGLRETLAGALDHWIRRRLRAYLWTLWKLPRTKGRNLSERGVAHRWAVAVGNTRKGAWRLSKNGTVCAALPDDWFARSAGVILIGSFCH